MSNDASQARPIAALRRRDVLLLGATVLAGCGGGSSSTSALPGTGGTGIGVQGPITGFGSVIINGIKYDDRTATVRLNGQPANSADLRIGMVAEVQGTKSATNLGVAERIDIWSVAQGPISQVDSVASLTVAGMTVHTGNSTSYEGCANYAGLAIALTAGAWATVWGVQVSADGREWNASRIKVSGAPASSIVSSGVLHVSGGGGISLNGWTLTGAGVAALTDDQLVRIEGQVTGPTSLSVGLNGARVLDASTTLDRAEAEVEGLVTAFTSNTDFSIGTLRIDATNAAISPNGASVALGSRLEVNGALVNRVLVAREIEVKDANASANTGLDITGTVTQFNALSDFEVRGQKCDASHNPTVSGGSLNSLTLGSTVRVKGTTQGEETLVVSELIFQ